MTIPVGPESGISSHRAETAAAVMTARGRMTAVIPATVTPPPYPVSVALRNATSRMTGRVMAPTRKARLSSGDHVVVCDDAYGGVYRLFEQNYRKYGLNFTYVDTTEPKNVLNAIRDETRIVWLETPTNPLLKISNLKEVKQIFE